MRWTWKSPNGVTKPDIDYVRIHRPDIFTNVVVDDPVNIGSDHTLVMNNTTLDVLVKRKESMTKRLPIVNTSQGRILARVTKQIRGTTRTRRH